MGLSLDSLTPQGDPRAGCRVGKKLLPLLSEKDRDKFYELLDDPKYPCTHIARQLRPLIAELPEHEQFKLTASDLQRHARNACGCEEVGMR